MRVLWLGVLAALGACATSDGNLGTVTQAIQGGVTDATDKFAVGVCRNVGRTPGHCEDYCSGALVLPNVVATARHCVSAAPDTVDCTTSDPEFGAFETGPLYITTNTTMDPTTGDAGWYKVVTAHVPSDAHICGHDIALLELETAVPADVARPLTPGVQYSIWDPEHYGASFAAIGYGNQSTAPNDGLGTRRKLDYVSVLCVPGSDTPCAQPFDDGEFVGGGGPCAGDSGSSAVERRSYDEGAPVSLGVLSRGAEKGTECTGSIYTRFDTERDFVLAVARIASAGWTKYPEPSWTTPKPAAIPKSQRDAGSDAGNATDAACAGCDTDAGTTSPASDPADGGCALGRRHGRASVGGVPLLALLALGARRLRIRSVSKSR